jgi:hypothetical protein
MMSGREDDMIQGGVTFGPFERIGFVQRVDPPSWRDPTV